MKSVIIIPSRWKSSRFAGKSLALIDGVPMIQRVYERAIKSKEADDVIIATDDKRIFNFCKKNKLKVIITSKNAKNGAERISFATRKIDSKIFVNVQGDCPLINPKSIDKVIFCLKNNISKGYHVSAGCATDNNLKQDKRNSLGFVVISKSDDIIYTSRSTIPFYKRNHKKVKMFRTVGLFAYTKEIIKKFPLLKSDLEKYEDLEILRFLENNIKVKCAHVKEEISDVNYKSDIKRVENLLRKTKK